MCIGYHGARLETELGQQVFLLPEIGESRKMIVCYKPDATAT
jgi:hypothetical protein